MDDIDARQREREVEVPIGQTRRIPRSPRFEDQRSTA
jgi:hypothetical protein